MYVDPRGPRVAAWITTVVLAAVLLTGNGWLLLAQAVVFALGAFRLRFAPYGILFRYVIAPRLGPPGELEAAAPPRFAQFMGFVFAVAGTVGYLAGLSGLGMVATSLALVAAFLNAAFGLCLGCEMYLLFRRIFTSDHRTATSKGATT